MKPIHSQICVHLCSSVVALGFAFCASAAAQTPTWQCTAGGASAMSPALADAARDYLGRVEAIYPHQVLGLVRAGGHYYLLNSRDVEWGERTRLYLMTLRLQDAAGTSILRPTIDSNAVPSERYGRSEAYVTPERRAVGAAPGGRPPAGSFVCLAASRAEREGLTRTPFGEVVLAAGQSVHLVDPHEPQVAVEVRAGRDQPLNLGEIFHRSSRAGIYAGLAGQPRQPAGAAALSRPDGTLVFRTASAGGSVVETRIAPEPEAAAPAASAPDTVVAAAPTLAVPAEPRPEPRSEPVREEQLPAPVVAAPPVPPVAPEMVAIAAPPREPEPALAAEPAAPIAATRPAPASARPASARIPDAPPIARAAPAVLPSTAVVAQPAPTGAIPAAYEDYAKAMKTLMALKRSRSVLSVGEMTYVHPAVEVLRGRMPQ